MPMSNTDKPLSERPAILKCSQCGERAVRLERSLTVAQSSTMERRTAFTVPELETPALPKLRVQLSYHTRHEQN